MQFILIGGDVGSGKTMATLGNNNCGIKGLPPKETVYFRGIGLKNLPPISKDLKVEDVSDMEALKARVKQYVFKSNIKHIVLDDFHFSLFKDGMSKAQEKGYDKFIQMADTWTSMWREWDTLIKGSHGKFLNNRDVTIYWLLHTEDVVVGDEVIGIKLKTLGKMVDQYIAPPSLFTTALSAEVIPRDELYREEDIINIPSDLDYLPFVHRFRVYRKYVKDIVRCLPGTFGKSMYIPNDLGYVNDQMIAYNNANNVDTKVSAPINK